MTTHHATQPSLLSTLSRGLAGPARLSCLLAVREQPCTVNEVVMAMGLSQPNVSKHLAYLRDCGLVRAERSGRFVSYQLAHPQVEVLLQATDALLASGGRTGRGMPPITALVRSNSNECSS